jgi:hypothetical protein
METRLRGHSSTVLHIDWSRCGRYLQSQCSARELLRWRVGARPSCAQHSPAHVARVGRPASASALVSSAMAQGLVKWHTWTCTIGFPVMGIYPDGSDTGHVNVCDVSRAGDLVVTGDDDGLLKVLHHPCVVEDAPSKAYMGHSTKVANCCFTAGDTYVVSVGSDACVFQYRLVRAETEARRGGAGKFENSAGSAALSAAGEGGEGAAGRAELEIRPAATGQPAGEDARKAASGGAGDLRRKGALDGNVLAKEVPRLMAALKQHKHFFNDDEMKMLREVKDFVDSFLASGVLEKAPPLSEAAVDEALRDVRKFLKKELNRKKETVAFADLDRLVTACTGR